MNIFTCRARFRASGCPPYAGAARTLAQLVSNGTILATELFPGGVAERLNAPVLKTGRPKGLVSSNLTPSAKLISDCRFWIADSPNKKRAENCKDSRANHIR